MIALSNLRAFSLSKYFFYKILASAFTLCNNIGTSGNTVGESGKKCFTEVLHIL